MRLLTIALLCALTACRHSSPEPVEEMAIWVTADSHVTRDIKQGYESLATPIRNIPFEYDIAVSAGDLTASQYPPTEHEWREYQRQALDRDKRYEVAGNHDSAYYGDPSGFARFVDPMGTSADSGNDPSKKPCPVYGETMFYAIDCGRVLVLMLSDENSAPSPVGRGTRDELQKGGFPTGAVTREAFEWWKTQVLNNQHRVIITVHHHVLRDTTTFSSYGDGCVPHGSSGGCDAAGYLAYTIESWEPFEYTMSVPGTPGPFETFLADFHQSNGRAAIDLWLGGHSHAGSELEENSGKGLVEKKWGVTFAQVSGLTAYHGHRGMVSSRLLTIGENVTLKLFDHDRGQFVREDIIELR